MISLSLSFSVLETFIHISFFVSVYTACTCQYLHKLTSLVWHEPNCWILRTHMACNSSRNNTPILFNGYVAGQQPNHFFFSHLLFIKVTIATAILRVSLTLSFLPLLFLFIFVRIHLKGRNILDVGIFSWNQHFFLL